MPRAIAAAAAVLCACAPPFVYVHGDAGGQGTVAMTAGGTSGTGASAGAGTRGTGSGTSGSSTGGTGGSGSSTTASDFIMRPDVIDETCDTVAQDCPAGEKCAPASSDGGPWHTTRCSPLAPAPKGPYEPCTVQESYYSGVDDCDVGAFCWFVDPATLQGICWELCSGSEYAPECVDPKSECIIYGDATITLCYPVCHPLLGDCPAGQVCAQPVYADSFHCRADTSGGMSAPGSACAGPGSCGLGLECAPMEVIPGCNNGDGCCTPYCDLGQAQPDAPCTAIDAGLKCESMSEWLEPQFADVGWCVASGAP